MNKIEINSKLYNYSVEFIEDFKKTLSQSDKSIVYVIDKKYNFFLEYSY